WGLAALGIFLVIGEVPRLPHDPALGIVGGLVVLAAGVPLFLARPRWPLAYAAAAMAGGVLLNAHPRGIGRGRGGGAGPGWRGGCWSAASGRARPAGSRPCSCSAWNGSPGSTTPAGAPGPPG